MDELVGSAQEYLQIGEVDLALGELEMANTRYPSNHVVLDSLASIYANEKNDHLMAAIYFSEIAQLSPDNNAYRLMAAQSYRTTGDLRAAVNECRTYLNQSPNQAPVWKILGNLYEALNEPAPAIEAYANNYRLSPNGEIAFRMGMIFKGLGNYAQTRAWLETALSHSDFDRELTLLELFNLSVLQKDYTGAEDLAERIQNEFPGSLDLSDYASQWTELQNWRRQQENLERTIDDQQKIRAEIRALSENRQEDVTVDAGGLDPNHQDDENLAGEEAVPITNAELAELDGGESASDREDSVDVADSGTTDQYETVMESNDSVTEVNEDGNQLNAELRSLEEAEKRVEEDDEPDSDSPYRRAAIQPPATWKSHLENGWSLYEAEDFQEAVKQFYTSISMNNDVPEPWFGLSRCYLAQKELSWAESTALEAMRRKPESVVYHLQYLNIIQKTKAPAVFYRELQMAQTRFPDNPEIILALARSQRDFHKNPDYARRLYLKFLQMAPQHPQAEAVRNELQNL